MKSFIDSNFIDELIIIKSKANLSCHLFKIHLLIFIVEINYFPKNLDSGMFEFIIMA